MDLKNLIKLSKFEFKFKKFEFKFINLYNNFFK